MKSGKSGEDDGISGEVLKSLPPSAIRRCDEHQRRVLAYNGDTLIIPLRKKMSVTEPRNYRAISLLHVTYKVLERIILDRLIKHRE
ncbi:hypothetical protein RB195_003145 [Necator americanus]|uniref:Uncharacterized protein n=1 Tax=Necator americanus TaxID=51031 RepID=A0ABR1DNK0_NECAM